MEFTNKVVIITGASSGIGAATAILFAKQSAKLVLVGRNEICLKQVAKLCEESRNIEPLIVRAELTNDDDVKNIVTKTIERFGQIDVLVNNAGFGFRGCIRDGIETFDLAISTNVRPAYLLTGFATPHLVQSKGNIINVSSIAASKPIQDIDFLPYCVTKAALDQFTRCVASELGKDGVRVNAVSPGCTKTGFFQTCGFSEQNTEGLFEYRSKTIPLRRVVTSENVADLILFLASDRASCITGSIYVIDSGESLQ